MKSLTQHIHNTSPKPAGTAAQTFPMTLRDFIDSLEFFDNKDRIVEVFMESPIENALCVKFPPIEETPYAPGNRMIQNDGVECPEAPTDQDGNLSPTFELSVVRVGDELPDLRDYISVEVTLDKHDATKVLLKFKRAGE